MAIIEVNFISKCLMRVVTFNAIIPVDKFGPQAENAEQKPLKTLYLLHGIFGNYTDWVNGTRIQAWAEANDLAVIMPSGENRFYLDDEKSGELYGEFIGKELVEFTRKLFPLSDKREDTFIAGLSMGGYGTLKCVLQTPERYAGAAAFSAVADIEEFVAVQTPAEKRELQAVFGQSLEIPADCNLLALAEKADAARLPKLYMACGEQDALYAANVRLADKLTALGADIRFEHWTGIHNWEFWDAAVGKALDHLL